MQRRSFIRLLAGLAATPIAARAQVRASPTIGFLHSAAANSYAAMVAAFRTSLREAGYIEDQGLGIEYRWADGHLERLPDLANDLVQHRVSLIFAGGGSDACLAAKAATSKIPILFANGTDPVEAGLVASLNRPGGNVTGITFLIDTLGPKQLETLHEIMPKASLVGVLLNPTLSTAAAQLKDMQAAATTLGQNVQVFRASTVDEIDVAFNALSDGNARGLVIAANSFFFGRRDQLVGLAERHQIPAVYPWREAVTAGGLASYGASVSDAYRLAGKYAARILKGERPADLPVQESSSTEVVINLKTANALGLVLPLALLGRAGEVME